MIATESRWGRRTLFGAGGGKRVDQINDVGSDCANAACREAEERGGFVWIEGLESLTKRHEEQPEGHAKTKAKDARGQEVSHVRSLRCYALVDDVAWHERNNEMAADAGVACPSPCAERLPSLCSTKCAYPYPHAGAMYSGSRIARSGVVLCPN